jgi:hypothetical protein
MGWTAARDRLGAPLAVFLLIVVGAAGASGVALLAFPGSTGRYFSWELRPPEAAALIGGLYLASAVVFGVALTRPLREVRGLCVAVLGLAVPTLALTLVHDEVFDWTRWQAVVWLALFVTTPLTMSVLLGTLRFGGRDGDPLAAGTRWALGALALVLAGLAPLIWTAPTRAVLSAVAPVELRGLAGAYLGSWCSFLAVLCAWSAARGTREDARLTLLALAAVGVGGLLAAARTFPAPDPARLGYLLVLALMVAVPLLAWRRGPTRR